MGIYLRSQNRSAPKLRIGRFFHGGAEIVHQNCCHNFLMTYFCVRKWLGLEAADQSLQQPYFRQAEVVIRKIPIIDAADEW